MNPDGVVWKEKFWEGRNVRGKQCDRVIGFKKTQPQSTWVQLCTTSMGEVAQPQAKNGIGGTAPR
jgi:hypothetical protein